MTGLVIDLVPTFSAKRLGSYYLKTQVSRLLTKQDRFAASFIPPHGTQGASSFGTPHAVRRIIESQRALSRTLPADRD